jgi:hypothetical protein
MAATLFGVVDVVVVGGGCSGDSNSESGVVLEVVLVWENGVR